MKKYIISLFILAATVGAKAQMTDYSHNLQFSLGGGIHSLLYTPVNGDYHIGFGSLGQVQYQLMVNHHVGFGLGLQASYLNASTTYNYYQTDNGITLPSTSTPVDVETRYYKWEEHQQLGLVSVPLQLILRMPIDASKSIQCGLGVIFSTPFASTYNTTGGAYIRTSTPSMEDNPLLGAHNDKQSGTFTAASFSTGVAIDLGVGLNLTHHTALYVGLYATYDHHNILPDDVRISPLFSYKNDSYSYNGSFASDRLEDVNPLQCGIKLGLRIGAGKFMGWKEVHEAELAAAAQARADSTAAAEAAEQARLEAEQHAREMAVARARAEAEAQAKAAADSIAAIHAAELAKARAEAENQAKAKAQAEAEARAAAEAATRTQDSLARAMAAIEAQAKAAAEAEAKARAEAEAIARAKAEQKAREEAAFIAGFSDTAHFETGKDLPIFAALNADSWDNLREVMDSHPEIKVTIVGHTDNTGSAQSNKALSQRRADNIKKMLEFKGIDPKRITAIGVGKDNPIAPNTTPAGRAKNRCIVITIGK